MLLKFTWLLSISAGVANESAAHKNASSGITLGAKSHFKWLIFNSWTKSVQKKKSINSL